jgi:NADP-reducing hydrogenase subunit HndB
MTKLTSCEELARIREAVRRNSEIRTNTGTRIVIAIVEELQEHDIDADVVTVGCIGMCSKEPLVDIQQAGRPRITYCNVHPDMVVRLIEEHLVKGHVVHEWAMGRVPREGIGQPCA